MLFSLTLALLTSLDKLSDIVFSEPLARLISFARLSVNTFSLVFALSTSKSRFFLLNSLY